MIKIEVTGETAEQVLWQLRELAGVETRRLTEDEERAIKNAERDAEVSREALQAERKAARKQKVSVEEPVGKGGETQTAAPDAIGTGTITETKVDVLPAEETQTEAGLDSSDEPLSFETDVAPVVLRKVQSAGKPAVERVLAEFGVERASQLDAARWPELLEKLGDLG